MSPLPALSGIRGNRRGASGVWCGWARIARWDIARNAISFASARKILKDIGKEIGSISVDIDPHHKHMRTAGFGGGIIRNDDFINDGPRPDIFKN